MTSSVNGWGLLQLLDSVAAGIMQLAVCKKTTHQLAVVSSSNSSRPNDRQLGRMLGAVVMPLPASQCAEMLCRRPQMSRFIGQRSISSAASRAVGSLSGVLSVDELKLSINMLFWCTSGAFANMGKHE